MDGRLAEPRIVLVCTVPDYYSIDSTKHYSTVHSTVLWLCRDHKSPREKKLPRQCTTCTLSFACLWMDSLHCNWSETFSLRPTELGNTWQSGFDIWIERCCRHNSLVSHFQFPSDELLLSDWPSSSLQFACKLWHNAEYRSKTSNCPTGSTQLTTRQIARFDTNFQIR